MNTIGWIGLGRMGNPMCARLLNAGYRVTVYNRTKDKTTPLISSGARFAETPSEIIQQSEIIFLMISDDTAVKAIFQEEGGLLGSGAKGRIIINMSTVSPGVSKEMAGLCRETECHYIDAPVSGSVKQAESGELVIMAGGEKEIFQKIEPLLGHIGKLALHVGGTGSGNTMKLAVNLLLGIISQGLSEAVVFSKDHGLETAQLLEIIANSALGNVYMKIKGDAILNENYNAAFALKHITKDLRLARDAGMNTPLGNTALDTFENAEKELAEKDVIAVYKFLEK